MASGVLLDPTTGRSRGRARVPLSREVEVWRRELAERDVREQLHASRRHPGLQATTTTNRYLTIPAAAAGGALATGTVAWTFTAWTQLVAASTITATFYIAGLAFQTRAASATATTNEFLIELGTGVSGSEVTAVQVPFTVRNVTAAGYIPPAWIQLPEPKQIAANTRISWRFATSVAAAMNIDGLKMIYETA